MHEGFVIETGLYVTAGHQSSPPRLPHRQSLVPVRVARPAAATHLHRRHRRGHRRPRHRTQHRATRQQLNRRGPGRAKASTPKPRALTTTLAATSSAKCTPSFVERLSFLVECGVGIDGHRDFDVAVADDAADDVRRDAEVKQQRDAGARCRGTARPRSWRPCWPGPSSARQIARLQRRANAGREDQVVLLPVGPGVRPRQWIGKSKYSISRSR
jgi:hypothetical protein